MHLSCAQVSDADLDWHISEAVNVARPRRIGHGDDLPFEREALATLQEMKVRRGCVGQAPAAGGAAATCGPAGQPGDRSSDSSEHGAHRDSPPSGSSVCSGRARCWRCCCHPMKCCWVCSFIFLLPAAAASCSSSSMAAAGCTDLPQHSQPASHPPTRAHMTTLQVWRALRTRSACTGRPASHL